MGAACCTAAKDKTILNEHHGETLQRHTRYSPTWSFRWENRGRVAGEESTANWLHDENHVNGQVEVKSGTTVETGLAPEGSSRLDSLRSISGQQSPDSKGNADQGISCTMPEVKVPSRGTPPVSHTPPLKSSSSAPSVSSVSTSPPSSQNELLIPSLTPSGWNDNHSPGHHLLRRLADSWVPGNKSPPFLICEETPSLFLPPASGNESTRGSNGGSSDNWSIPVLSEFMATRRERWSFDSENSSLSREKIRSSGWNSRSHLLDLQTCGVCVKLLTERSSWLWSSQNVISTNELAVVSVLICGHVYHAECLEHMTPEINKYDPPCPVCTFGEKRALKMSEKALKAELDTKVKRKSKNCVIDSNLNSDIMFDNHKHNGFEERSRKMSSSTSMKSSLRKPFLKRHFSFSSKSGKSLSENQSTPRTGVFWTRSKK